METSGRGAPGHPGQWFGILLLVVAGLGLPAEPRAQADERAALIALYDATGGPQWETNTNWTTDAPLSEWHGVGTGAGGRVTHLDLNDNTLRGSIPAELGLLSNLEELFLYENDLTGPIPPELGNLANLSVLDLGNNNLTGSIPPVLGSLSNLEELLLHDNNLTGSIPPELGALFNLRMLILYDNNLTGSIPPELGALSNLRWLSLHTNNLTGSIPPEFVNLVNLWRLHLHNNAGLCAPADAAFQAWLETIREFTGEICADPVPAAPALAQILLAMLLLCGGAYCRARRRRT